MERVRIGKKGRQWEPAVVWCKHQKKGETEQQMKIDKNIQDRRENGLKSSKERGDRKKKWVDLEDEKNVK